MKMLKIDGMTWFVLVPRTSIFALLRTTSIFPRASLQVETKLFETKENLV